MKLTALLAGSLFLALPASTALAQHEHEHERVVEPPRALPPRAAPPRYQPHPPGVHPHGAIVRPHQVRVMAPKVVKYGGHEWKHWAHPEFARPHYYWDWSLVHHVSCIAEDSYGDQYPVTEAAVAGFGLANMTAIEDDALDRCAAESGGDPSCYLASCSHF